MSQDRAIVFTSQHGATPTRHGLAKQERQTCLKGMEAYINQLDRHFVTIIGVLMYVTR